MAQGKIDRVDAKLLLRNAAQVSAVTLVAHPEQALAPEQAAQFADWLARRVAGEPVAYLLGAREFYGRMFSVTPQTLIPRPDTELLVELTLEKAQGWESPRVLDLGTGSGAIAVSVACERPGATVTAVDASAGALEVATRNAAKLGAEVRFLLGDWLAPVKGESFEVIASNPPYIAPQDEHLSQGDLRFEPQSALSAKEDGLADLRRIIEQAPAHLSPNGWLLLEHGYDQAQAVRALLSAAGFAQVQSWQDLAGIERVSGGLHQ